MNAPVVITIGMSSIFLISSSLFALNLPSWNFKDLNLPALPLNSSANLASAASKSVSAYFVDPAFLPYPVKSSPDKICWSLFALLRSIETRGSEASRARADRIWLGRSRLTFELFVARWWGSSARTRSELCTVAALA